MAKEYTEVDMAADVERAVAVWKAHGGGGRGSQEAERELGNAIVKRDLTLRQAVALRNAYIDTFPER